MRERPSAVFVALFFAAVLMMLLASCSQGSSSLSFTYLFISPTSYVAKEVGERFNVTINIDEVRDLHSLEFSVSYNKSLLSVKRVVQDSFLPPPPESNFAVENDGPAGLVRVNLSFSRDGVSRSGNGTLATVEFEVAQYSESCVNCPIRLEQTLLMDSVSAYIAHDTVGAVYFWKSTVPDPPPEGRMIDVYTQLDGIGPDHTGGIFVLGENVKLLSKVTYNDGPVQQKLVAFEVKNSADESVVLRSATTDQDGIAMIEFRIPFDQANVGTWKAISVVDLAGTTLWDTITFQVILKLPVGGYSFAIERYAMSEVLAFYSTIVVVAAFAMIGRRTRALMRTGRRTC